MTNQQHPITPPPELVQQWNNEAIELGTPRLDLFIAARAAQWGSDQELEACCKALHERLGLLSARGENKVGVGLCDWLRNARRPKPPSLKEQALDQLTSVEDRYGLINTDYIRRALEQLDE